MGQRNCAVLWIFYPANHTFACYVILPLSDHFLQVIINFPDPAHKSDIVQLRGPKNEVEKCTKYMQKMVADLV